MFEQPELQSPVSSDTFEDIKEPFRQIARTYGREMLQFTLDVQLSRIAINKLAVFINKHASRHAQQDLTLVINAFNRANTSFVAAMGWTEEQLNNCTAELEIAFRQESPRIVLPTQH